MADKNFQTSALTIKILQKQRNEFTDKSEGLEGEVSKLTAMIGNNEEKIYVLSSEIEHLMTNVAENYGEVIIVKKRILDLEYQVSDIPTGGDDIKSQLEEKVANNTEPSEKNAEPRKELDSTKVKIETLTAEISEVTYSKNGIHNEVDDLSASLSAKKGEISSNMEELASVASSHDELSTKAADIDVEVVELFASLKEKASELNAKTSKISTLESDIAIVEAEKNREKKMSDDVIIDLKKLSLDKEVSLQAKIYEQSEMLGGLDMKVAELSLSLTTKEDDLVAKTNEADDALVYTKTEILALTDELKKVTAESEILQKEADLKNADISKIPPETEKMLADKEADLIMNKDTVVAGTSLCTKLNTKSEELENAITYLAEKLAQREVDLHEAEIDITDLQFDLAKSNTRNEEYEMRADNLDGHVIVLTGSVTTMMADRDKIAAALDQRDNQYKMATQKRQKKLHGLIDYEVSIRKPDGDVLTKARGMRASLERHSNYVEAARMILRSAITEGENQ